jgi:hypothetical protein
MKGKQSRFKTLRVWSYDDDPGLCDLSSNRLSNVTPGISLRGMFSLKHLHTEFPCYAVRRRRERRGLREHN